MLFYYKLYYIIIYMLYIYVDKLINKKTNRSELNNIIGMFVNSLPIRINLNNINNNEIIIIIIIIIIYHLLIIVHI